MRPAKNKYIVAGADLGFSGGERGFSKNIRKFCQPFFRPTKIDFLSSPIALQRPCFGQKFCAAGKIMKNREKRRFRHFLEKVDQKIAFFRRARPLKIEYILAPLEKF